MNTHLRPSACLFLAASAALLSHRVAAQAASATPPANAGDLRSWAAVYGTRDPEQVLDVAAAPGGGALMVGFAIDAVGGTDAWLVRLDGAGAVLWEQTLGGAGRDELAVVSPVPGGGFLAAGTTDSAGAGGTDGWLVRLAADGAVEWEVALGGAGDEELTAVEATASGAFAAGRVVDARTGSDAWVASLDARGGVVWQQVLAGSLEDLPGALAATGDGGVAVVVNTNSDFGPAVPPAPFVQPWLVVFDRGGALQWQRTYNVSGGDYWSDLVALDDGGFAATGEALSAAFFRGDLWVVRLDARGGVRWDLRTGDHLRPGVDAGRRLIQVPGGFVVAGSTGTAGAGDEDLWLVKVTAAGSREWNRVFGGGSFDNGSAVAPSGSGFLFAGISSPVGLGLPDAIAVRVPASGLLGDDCLLQLPVSPNVWTGSLAAGTPELSPTPGVASSVPIRSRVGLKGVVARYLCGTPQ